MKKLNLTLTIVYFFTIGCFFKSILGETNLNQNNSFDDGSEEKQSASKNDWSIWSDFKSRRLVRICVSVSPAHVSTRDGPIVSFECNARVCYDTDVNQNENPYTRNQYKFRRPIFDWNTQFSHLHMSNGTCDSSGLNCWHKVDLNVRALGQTMEQEGLEQIEIKCTVADYIHSYDIYNYVYGDSNSIIRLFSANEPCNSTNECGEYFVCNPTDQKMESSSIGICECPTEQLIKTVYLEDQDIVQPFVLAKDPHYREEVCVPVRTYNQSCVYDEQCKAISNKLYCRKIYDISDDFDTSTSICDCPNNLQWNIDAAQCMKIGFQTPNMKLFEKVTTENSKFLELTNDTTTDNYVYIWWIFPPFNNETNQSTHGLIYYGSRILNDSKLIFMFFVLISIFFPLTIITMTIIFYCHRKVTQTKQYAMRRTSFTDSVYSQENLPPSPSKKDRSITFGFENVEQCIPVNNTLLFTFNKKKKNNNDNTKEDKLDLVENDQVENFP
ncbi:hypothetical protein RDWZM_008811 [Blomia tropicalis]|uniref:Uncharacterized protein n=1 Tax=Blomia tropicalis TaxID=40697 RepID=A0A9Q0M2D3_BLOTA|nr:hypothetical protein RDWZM_008811 [Blomia tropicalis]